MPIPSAPPPRSLPCAAWVAAGLGGPRSSQASGTASPAPIVLPPFEMAVREGRPRSVMHAYTDTDGIPSAADPELLTGLLRDRWGFAGTVVADYFGIAFLKLLHGVAADWTEAAAMALASGVDVELPTVKTFGQPLLDGLLDGRIDESLVDRALRRVLVQKAQLGLLDPDWSPVPSALAGLAGLAVLDGESGEEAEPRGRIDLDGSANRALAERIAEAAVVLVRNDGTLPLGRLRRIAVVGPNADTAQALLGCYSFPVHVGSQHPDMPPGIELPTLLGRVREEFPGAEVVTTNGTGIDTADTSGIAAAVMAARGADVVVLALGDRAGLFGRGTSGEGCDAESLEIPGRQRQLLDALLDTGTPVVLVLLAGRPYALGRAVTEAAAIVQAFFPGEEGARAVAGVLSGRVNPSGRLPSTRPCTRSSPKATWCCCSPRASSACPWRTGTCSASATARSSSTGTSSPRSRPSCPTPTDCSEPTGAGTSTLAHAGKRFRFTVDNGSVFHNTYASDGTKLHREAVAGHHAPSVREGRTSEVSGSSSTLGSRRTGLPAAGPSARSSVNDRLGVGGGRGGAGP
ncbi:glycoside hydrolase family 3 C-terminal domain-containing protein [Kitasatospora sp. NBC_01287]|uniref:glycoside hydrolase family 3 C-terminal domain-containing protein n=1 Tax=Kitasatospora sp. NBC_01287 TaxID=2903573 RepID=UPI00225301DD|nr:glycoside hydrolase family 3 C-terminal domain-containing protein [Kitasatospora sp. NBC_01287]MCX4744738.1 glycoside hydrolase family 3 C-terminal domain-containing protein [Kitasatospora sp. NBC_01287]